MADSIKTDLIIDGEWRAPSGGQYEAVQNPAAPDQMVGRYASASRRDTGEAIEAAAAAQPAWEATGFLDRAEGLIRIVANLQEGVEERAHLLVRENGKLLRESQIEMTRLGDRFSYTASLARDFMEEDVFDSPPVRTTVTFRPLGVAALIVPYNWPLSILGAKLPQALLAGNTVVVKPPPTAPLAMVKTIKLMADALPPGVINVVTGPTEVVGAELLENRLVRKVDFTGSVNAGKQIMAAASQTLKPITLELGGNDPAIILDDAHIDDAMIKRLVLGAFLTAGQICMAIKRLYVHRSLFNEVRREMADVLSGYVVGDGMAEESSMGPVNNERQLDVVRGLVADARQRGGTVEEFGRPRDEDEFKKGWFHLPTLVTQVDHSFRVVNEEQFGPVLPIMPFDTEDEAVALANDSDFGLCSSVWSSDLERAEHVARKIDAGYTYINVHGPMGQDNRAPFGGIKNSGFGRQLGKQGVLEFLTYHSISAPQ